MAPRAETGTLIRVEAPHFVAGVVMNSMGHIVRTAPILAWSIGKPGATLLDYCRRKGWHTEVSP